MGEKRGKRAVLNIEQRLGNGGPRDNPKEVQKERNARNFGTEDLVLV